MSAQYADYGISHFDRVPAQGASQAPSQPRPQQIHSQVLQTPTNPARNALLRVAIQPCIALPATRLNLA